MKRKEQKYFILFFMVQLIIALFFYFYHHFSLLYFINALFVIGWIFTIVGAFMYVSEKGFFKLSSYGFKKIQRFLRFKKTYDEEDNMISFEEYLMMPNSKYDLTWPILGSGLFSLILSFLFAYTIV